MIRLDETLDARIPKLDANQRIKTAIDYLLLVEDCHTGALTQSGDSYMHGDLSSANAMYDQHGKLRLIDFGFSQKLTKVNQLRDDYKDVMRTLHHTQTEEEERLGLATIFDTTQFNNFPIHLQKTLAWQKELRPDVQPEQHILFIAAVLIAYQENPKLSEEDIENLKADSYAQIILVEQYKRKEAILRMPTLEAQKTLNKMLHTLERYQKFLNRKCEQPSGTLEDQMLFAEKKGIITQLVRSIQEKKENRSPQELLAILDKVLLENESVLSPTTSARLTGVFGYIQSKISAFSGEIATHTLTHKLDAKINMNTHVYRTAMQDQRDRSGTETTSNSCDSSKDGSVSDKNDSASDQSEQSPHRH